MEARTKTVEDWFAMIRDGHLTLPRFQRFEAWHQNQISGVLENVLRKPSLPIGALLTLEVGDRELFHSRPIFGAPEPCGTPKMNLLDGQQRVTALWRSLNDDYDEFTVFVSLKNMDCPEVQIVRRYNSSKTGKRMPLWADEPKECLERKLIPVSILCPGSQGEQKEDNWTEDAQADKDIRRTITAMRYRIANYQIPFLSLPVVTEQETALDVYVKMNTSASQLKDFDIVVAQIESAAGNSLHEMIRQLREEVPVAADYGKLEDMALAVGALLNNEPPLKKTYLNPEFGSKLFDVWGQVKSGLKRGLEFLRDEESIFNGKLLPTEVIIYLTSALWADMPTDGADKEGRARRLIRQAIWRASFTDRYYGAATQRAYVDYKSIGDLIKNPSAETPILFDEKQTPLPEEAGHFTRSSWPSRKDKLARAIVAASLLNGGFDFADGARATAQNVGKREYHHIYPRSLIEGTFEDYEVNSALNCALISWKTNRKISAKTPKEYIEERAQDASATESEIRERLESHLIPYDCLIDGDFRDFLKARSKLIHEAMQKLCQGLRL